MDGRCTSWPSEVHRFAFDVQHARAERVTWELGAAMRPTAADAARDAPLLVRRERAAVGLGIVREAYGRGQIACGEVRFACTRVHSVCARIGNTDGCARVVRGGARKASARKSMRNSGARVRCGWIRNGNGFVRRRRG
jgi:hypothetical protein